MVERIHGMDEVGVRFPIGPPTGNLGKKSAGISFLQKKIFNYMNQKGFIKILVIAIFVLIASAGIYFIATKHFFN